MATLTSANSAFVLTATEVFPAPQRLQGYAADDAFTVEAVDMAQTMIGVDGKLSAGYTPNPVNVNITLQADSPSIKVFDAIVAATQTTREVVFLDAVVSLPGTGHNYSLTRGVLTKATQVPAAKKTLSPQSYTIVFESVSKAVL